MHYAQIMHKESSGRANAHNAPHSPPHAHANAAATTEERSTPDESAPWLLREYGVVQSNCAATASLVLAPAV